MMTNFRQTELEQQLGLYQLFVKLYKNHSSLLDEIFQLENISQPLLKAIKTYYVSGVVDYTTVYLMTNLCENQTQSLQQPQLIWTIGRDRSSGIRIADSYLSRSHAAIEYIDNQGFYLVDFNSTNGSFVNGERVYQPMKLKDGDRIRLGSMTFNFFMNHNLRVLPTVAMELLMQLIPQGLGDRQVENIYQHNRQKSLTHNLDHAFSISKNSNFIEDLDDQDYNFSAEQKSEILDRFFTRQVQENIF